MKQFSITGRKFFLVFISALQFIVIKGQDSHTIWEIFPLRLESFDVSKKTEASSEISWTTTHEALGVKFVVERSKDGTNFHPITTLLARGLYTLQSYTYTDKNPLPDMNYYRLRIEGQGGSKEYSDVKILQFVIAESFSLYPNPAVSQTNVLLKANDGERMQINLVDVTGRILKQFGVTIWNQRAELKLAGVSSGIYWIVAIDEKGNRFKSKLHISAN